MSELRELYQEVILDHGKRPRGFSEMDDPTAAAHGNNPLCGDKITVYLRERDDRIDEVRFQGAGCAISMASASMMTEVLAGKSREEAERIYRMFHDLVTGRGDPDAPTERLGKLVVFAGVREFPIRVKCATLAWHTFHAALTRRAETVSTE